MDAQLTGYVMGDLSFQAHGDYGVSDRNEAAFNYRYGAYTFYNLGYKATAKVLNFVDWALSPREAFSPAKSIPIYERTGSIPMAKRKRALDAIYATNGNALGNGTYNSTLYTDTISLNHEADIFRRADGSMDVGK